MSYEALQKKIEKYISYYNNDRIQQKLAGMSPVNYRKTYQPISCIIKTLTLRGHYLPIKGVVSF
ncbi:IS3 family transposase [Lysinibacillus fusiformis]|uniref:IS3 family transposase n=1 Tax=Lysinibacillus TaxID=400634 RepID=UPI003AF32031